MVGWGKMSMVGQRESNDTFASALKAKELVVTRSSVLLFLFQWENMTVDLITMGSLIFGINIKISSDLLCPTILIFPTSPYLLKHEILSTFGCQFPSKRGFEKSKNAKVCLNLTSSSIYIG